jgi:hypothetical protein
MPAIRFFPARISQSPPQSQLFALAPSNDPKCLRVKCACSASWVCENHPTNPGTASRLQLRRRWNACRQCNKPPEGEPPRLPRASSRMAGERASKQRISSKVAEFEKLQRDT